MLIVSSYISLEAYEVFEDGTAAHSVESGIEGLYCKSCVLIRFYFLNSRFQDCSHCVGIADFTAGCTYEVTGYDNLGLVILGDVEFSVRVRNCSLNFVRACDFHVVVPLVNLVLNRLESTSVCNVLDGRILDISLEISSFHLLWLRL